MQSRFYAESIEWFIDDQAFSLSYDLAPRTPPAWLRKRDNLLTREVEEGGGWGAQSYSGEKVWSSINDSIISAKNLDSIYVPNNGVTQKAGKKEGKLD